MKAKERMMQLMAETKDEEVDALADWWDTVAITLPIKALWVLLQVADRAGTWVFDPISFHLNQDNSDRYPLSHIMNLSSTIAAEIHFLMHLESLGLLEVKETEPNCWEYVLTAKGAFAVMFWLDSMSDLSIQHDSLPTLTEWLRCSNHSTTSN